MVNVLQAVLLTEGEKMVKTPTWHVFRMYRDHQGAQALPVTVEDAGTAGGKLPAMQVSASRMESGAITVTAANLSMTESRTVRLALAGRNWFGNPAAAMTMTAVTGTNGKTTTTYLLKDVLEKTLGAKVGLIGTNQNMIGSEIVPTERTTPESFELQRLFRRMADAGCTHVVMEVSSHALSLKRVEGVRFAVGIFTNDEAIVRQGMDYLAIVRFSYLFFAVTTILLGGMRVVEKVNIALYVSIVALLLNIILPRTDEDRKEMEERALQMQGAAE